MEEIKLRVPGDTVGRINTPTEYVDDLIQQIENDIFPLFFFTIGQAPFTVLRNLFCFLDHTARLRYGNTQDSIKKIFLAGSFGTYGKIRTRYIQIYPFLIQLYRHELVHHIRPFTKKTKYQIQRSTGAIRKKGIDEFGFHISSDINKKLFSQGTDISFDSICKFLGKERNRDNYCHLRSVRDCSGKYNPVVYNSEESFVPQYV